MKFKMEKLLKITGPVFFALTFALMILSCSASYKDGTYKGQSETHINEDEDDSAGNGYGVVELTIKDNKIVSCAYKTYELDGKLKDGEYGKGADGKIANRDYFNKAQKAVLSCDQYAANLVKAGSLKGVDSISGATINYRQFKDAVSQALLQAKE